MVQEINGRRDEEGSESVGALDEVIEEKPKAKRKVRPGKGVVRVVGIHGKGIIVEIGPSDNLARMIAPSHVLEYRDDGTALLSKSDLDACIPYGADWEKHLEITVTAEAVAKMLRRRGIWTPADFEKHFLQARQGALGIISRDLIRMLQSAKKEATK